MERAQPTAKVTQFIEAAEHVRKSLPENAYEAIMIGRNGRFLEGLSSNFFAVKNGEIWTADEGVLPGVTRSIILKLAEQSAVPVHLEGIAPDDVAQIDEAFITSSSGMCCR
jgi:branched-subunit amino acid aminotransferase/4-amino-4-deoxychorismate lyase